MRDVMGQDLVDVGAVDLFGRGAVRNRVPRTGEGLFDGLVRYRDQKAMAGPCRIGVGRHHGMNAVEPDSLPVACSVVAGPGPLRRRLVAAFPGRGATARAARAYIPANP